MLAIFCLNEPVPGAPRHVGKTFRANIRRSDCARPISSNILRPKVDAILKLSDCKATTQITRVSRTHRSPNFHDVFSRDPDILHTCCTSPCRPVNEKGAQKVFFFADILGFLKAQF